MFYLRFRSFSTNLFNFPRTFQSNRMEGILVDCLTDLPEKSVLNPTELFYVIMVTYLRVPPALDIDSFAG